MSSHPAPSDVSRASNAESKTTRSFRRQTLIFAIVAIGFTIPFADTLPDARTNKLQNAYPCERIGALVYEDAVNTTLNALEYSWGCPAAEGATYHDGIWCANLDLIAEAFETDFIQGIRFGVVPDAIFNVTQAQTGYWLVIAGGIWQSVCDKTICTEGMKEFMDTVGGTYAAGGYVILDLYGLTLSDVDPTEETQVYLDFLEYLCTNELAVYSAVAIASDARLWSELAKRVELEGLYGDSEISQIWVDEILSLGPLQDLATSILETHAPPCDERALEVYRAALVYSIGFLEMTDGED